MTEIGELGRKYLEELLDGIKLPWPELTIPLIPQGSFGEYCIEEKDTPPVLRGYFRGLQRVRGRTLVLSRKGKLWMSCTPMEMESMVHHVACAVGCTVIAGLGLGVALYNMLAKPEVTKVCVIEKSKSVVEWFYSVPTGCWPGIEKLTILTADALRTGIDEPVDFLYVDIWERLGGDKALDDTIRIQKHVRAKEVGYWGQELDFISWMDQTGKKIPPLEEYYDKWIKSTGIPLLKVEHHWLWALEAATNVTMY